MIKYFILLFEIVCNSVSQNQNFNFFRKNDCLFRIHSALASRIRHTRNIRIADRKSNNKTKLSDVRIWII